MEVQKLIQGVLTSIRNEKVEKLYDLDSEEEVRSDRNCLKRIKQWNAEIRTSKI